MINFIRKVKGCSKLIKIRNEGITNELEIFFLYEQMQDCRHESMEQTQRMDWNRPREPELNNRIVGWKILQRPRKL